MSTVVAKNVQVGTSGTATDNFTIRQPATPDGTVRIANGNSGTTTDLVTVNSAGNVGVGTSSPISFATQTSVTVNGSVYGRFDIRSGGTHVANWYSDTTISGFGTITNIPLLFTTNNQERMRIDSSGNVGIGINYGLTNSRLVVAGQSAGGNGAYATGPGSIVLNETNRASINDIGGFEFKTSVFGSGYGAKLVALDNGTLVFGNRNNSATWSERMRLDLDGNLLVGTTTAGVDKVRISASHGPNANLGLVCADDINGNYIIFRNAATTAIGSVTRSGTSSVAYNTSSDYRLKNITGPITTSGAYIDNLNPVEGTWKADGSTFVGLIAHEVQEASRTPVATGTKDGEQMQGMDYSSAEIIANLIAEVKSLRQRLAAAGI